MWPDSGLTKGNPTMETWKKENTARQYNPFFTTRNEKTTYNITLAGIVAFLLFSCIIVNQTHYWDVPFFIRTPPKDGEFLHKGGRIFKSKEPPKNERFGNFFQRFRQKMNPSDFFLQRVPPKL